MIKIKEFCKRLQLFARDYQNIELNELNDYSIYADSLRNEFKELLEEV